MSRTRSDRSLPRRFAVATGLVLLAGLGSPLAAQRAGEAATVVSQWAEITREAATLRLDLADGRRVQLSVRDGAAYLDDRRIGDAPRGGELDRAWRALLNDAMARELTASEFASMVLAWEPPGTVGARMNEALTETLSVQEMAVDPDALVAPAVAPGAPSPDSLDRLLSRIAELEAATQRAEARASREARTVERRAARPARSTSPFRHIAQGISGIFSLLVTYVVLFAIGVAVIFFGGRRYIEGVADTARHATTRSLFVGLASSFLVIPAFVLGIIALVISIIGIPGLLVWVPGFPLAVVLGVLLGYLGIAHAAGEALAERRFYVNDWFQRGNSYYFLLSGLGLLLAFFLAGNVVQMAGPWLRVVRGLVMFLGFVTTFLAVMIGFGAVLISRAGTRPVRAGGRVDEPDLFTEEAGV
jgi:hypothetical protein